MTVFTDEQLVRKWVEAHNKQMNMSWVADELAVTRQAIETRKQKLAKLGVKFPVLPATRRTPVLHINGLNAIIEAGCQPPTPNGNK
jgi:hypothetical protein